jgi:hypothetical protein
MTRASFALSMISFGLVNFSSHVLSMKEPSFNLCSSIKSFHFVSTSNMCIISTRLRFYHRECNLRRSWTNLAKRFLSWDGVGGRIMSCDMSPPPYCWPIAALLSVQA